jgi:pimeloyl-ACP methyl ester carboxylesterase
MRQRTLTAALAALVILLGLWFGAPQLFLRPLIDLNRTLSGLDVRTIQIGDHQIAFLEGGSGETVVLLHGIFAEKDHWVEFARTLTDRYHVVIPDIAGFGESSRLENAAYTYAEHTRRLHAFFKGIGAGRVHLAGNSMGGTIAALYASGFSSEVASVAFIGAPHGIRTTEKSEGDRIIERGETPLVVRSPAAFDEMMRFLFVSQPFLPRPILLDAQARALAGADSNLRLWNDQLRDRFLLHDALPGVKVPVLGMWGSGDRMFHVSGLQRLQEAMPHGEFFILSDVGHLPMMERPRATGERYREFLDRLSDAPKN